MIGHDVHMHLCTYAFMYILCVCMCTQFFFVLTRDLIYLPQICNDKLNNSATTDENSSEVVHCFCNTYLPFDPTHLLPISIAYEQVVGKAFTRSYADFNCGKAKTSSFIHSDGRHQRMRSSAVLRSSCH